MKLPAVHVTRGDAIRLVVIAVLVAFVLFALPPMLSRFWMGVVSQGVEYAIVALGLGIMMGRVGLVSIGQIAILGIGAWVGARLLYATSVPFPIIIVMSGLITGVIGTIISLPALRLSGLYLALITLMLAGAVTLILTQLNFPNGGGGFLGYNGNTLGASDVRRPDIANSDAGYLRYAVVVAVVMFAIAAWHVRSKPGRAWEAIRQSEPAAMSAGVNITFYKLWALFFSAVLCGVAGALLAGDVGQIYPTQFPTYFNIQFLAVTIMGGMYTLWGALVAGFLYNIFPAMLDNWGVSIYLLTILFGVGILHAITTAPEGIAVQFPRDMKNLGLLIYRGIRKVTGGSGKATEESP